ncbi:heterogeneous nuclear ribonucleoprotein C-like [Lampetra fluviatilis]
MASASTQSGGGGGGGTRRVLSNRTDSTAPEDMKRRVFVGLKKLGHLGQYLELLRELFENFGPLDALSTFNGFAFMQFVNEKDAHSAHRRPVRERVLQLQDGYAGTHTHTREPV